MPNALIFDGNPKNYINLIVAKNTHSGIVQSIECWIKTDLKQEQTIIQGIGKGYGQPRWSINQTTHQFYWVEAEKTYESKSGPDLADGKWHHIAMTYRIDGNVAGSVCFYTDGKLVDKISIGYLGHIAASLGDVQLQFGAGYGSATSFKGCVTNIRIWNTIRSDEEIQNNFRSIIFSTNDLIASYPILSLQNPKEKVSGQSIDLTTGPGITKDFVPGQSINAISELKYYVPSKPFIQFSGIEGDIYSYIQSQLGLEKDIRSFYIDGSKSFQDIYTNLRLLTKPDKFDEANWKKVTSQLGFEFQAVSDIVSNFNSQATFLNSMGVMIGAELDSAITNSSIKTSTKVKSNFTEAIIGSILSIASYAASVVAKDNPEYAAFLGVAATLYGLANSVNVEHSDNNYDFEETVAGLKENYANRFHNLISTNAEMKNNLLTDWGKMESAENFIDDQFLFWSTETTKNLINNMGNEIKKYYYSVLLPKKWKIYSCVNIRIPFLSSDEEITNTSPTKCDNLKHKPPARAYNGNSVIIDFKLKSFPSEALINDLTQNLKIDIWNGHLFGGYETFTCRYEDDNQM